MSHEKTHLLDSTVNSSVVNIQYSNNETLLPEYLKLNTNDSEEEEQPTEEWGDTPGFRKLLLAARLQPNMSFSNLKSRSNSMVEDHNYGQDNDDDYTGSFDNDGNRIHIDKTWGVRQSLERLPGLAVAIIVNLFLSTAFGLAIFPAEWQFPDHVPRAIGVQMFLLATFICQVCLTTFSSFPWAMGMFMVENIPFLQVIARIAVKAQGSGIDTFSTVLFIFALSSIVVGTFFFVLGYFKLGNAVYFFPKHIIIGCIGGIGVFITLTGFEVSTNLPFYWTKDSLTQYFSTDIAPHWILSLLLECFLRFLKSIICKNMPLLSPIYFMLIPPMFYAALVLLNIPLETAHEQKWFFQNGPKIDDPFLIWELVQFSKINWSVVFESIPTIFALTFFSLMHVPINIPSLSMSTNCAADMNKELIAHGISNLISGFAGGLQNYLCYMNSLLYFKCQGQGKVSGYLLALFTAIFFYYGPAVVVFIPRCMAGCLLCHVGIDLVKEGVWDCRNGLDTFEYISVLAITFVMTFYGLTDGLIFGIICAAITFTLQISHHVPPIRRTMRGTTLRSSRWHSQDSCEILNEYSRHILVVQLQGQLFFGNATLFAADVETLLLESKRNHNNHHPHGNSNSSMNNNNNNNHHHHHHKTDIWYIILDFTLVLCIDSSAAETIASVIQICQKHHVKLVYSKLSGQDPVEFPWADKLTKRLIELRDKDFARRNINSNNNSNNNSSGSSNNTNSSSSSSNCSNNNSSSNSSNSNNTTNATDSNFKSVFNEVNHNNNNNNSNISSYQRSDSTDAANRAISPSTDIEMSVISSNSTSSVNSINNGKNGNNQYSDKSTPSEYHILLPTDDSFAAAVVSNSNGTAATATAAVNHNDRLFLADSLDDGLAWCEHDLLVELGRRDVSISSSACNSDHVSAENSSRGRGSSSNNREHLPGDPRIGGEGEGGGGGEGGGTPTAGGVLRSTFSTNNSNNNLISHHPTITSSSSSSSSSVSKKSYPPPVAGSGLTSVVGSSHQQSPLFHEYHHKPAYLRQLHALCPANELEESVDKLFRYFVLKETKGNDVILWRQGEASHAAIVLVSGKLINSLEEEAAGSTEEVHIGHLVGEYGLLTAQPRLGTLTAVIPSVYYELTLAKYEEMSLNEPKLALILAKICLGYLGHRVMHVSNRVWESRCLPV